MLVVTAEDFYRHVRKTPGCWYWMRSRTPKGYGTLQFRGKVTTAPRVAVIFDGREIPPGHEPHHKCLNPPCVRPDHLKVVTRSENHRLQRRQRKTHCPAGHLYAEHGRLTRMGPGKRPAQQCRTCQRDRKRNAIAIVPLTFLEQFRGPL